MQTPPPLPKPIVTYEMCDCDFEDCGRRPVRNDTCVGAEERRLRALRKAAA